MDSESEPQPQEIQVSASLLEKSCGVALDIGGSLAKIAYRCNKLYKDGKRIDETKASPDVGYVKIISLPREKVDTYVQYILDHADLTGDPPQVYSAGFGAVKYKETIEEKLKVILTILTEFQCIGSVILNLIKDSALPTSYHDVDTQGVEEGQVDAYRYIDVQYKLCDRLPAPAHSHLQEEVTKAVQRVRAMRLEDVRLPCLVVMCGSAFISFVLHEDGKIDYRDITWLGGRTFQGLAFLLTGEKDWSSIEKTLETHDGSTAYTYREAGSNPPEGATGGTDQGVDAHTFSTRNRCFPFGNADVAPRESIKEGDLLYALCEAVSTNIGAQAYNTALVHDLHQVLFCGSFIDNPQVRTIITRAIMWRNIFAYYKKDVNKLVDFRFIRNAGHLGAIGALVNTDDV